MKTSIEWFHVYKVNADKYLSISAIEAIQLDAYKQGVLDQINNTVDVEKICTTTQNTDSNKTKTSTTVPSQ